MAFDVRLADDPKKMDREHSRFGLWIEQPKQLGVLLRFLEGRGLYSSPSLLQSFDNIFFLMSFSGESLLHPAPDLLDQLQCVTGPGLLRLLPHPAILVRDQFRRQCLDTSRHRAYHQCANMSFQVELPFADARNEPEHRLLVVGVGPSGSTAARGVRQQEGVGVVTFELAPDELSESDGGEVLEHIAAASNVWVAATEHGGRMKHVAEELRDADITVIIGSEQDPCSSWIRPLSAMSRQLSTITLVTLGVRDAAPGPVPPKRFEHGAGATLLVVQEDRPGSSLSGLAEFVAGILFSASVVCWDFEDLKICFGSNRIASYACVGAAGPDRARRAALACCGAINEGPFDLSSACSLVMRVHGDPDLRMSEMQDADRVISSHCGAEADYIWTADLEERAEEAVVALFAAAPFGRP
jgi:hypothetical protein